MLGRSPEAHPHRDRLGICSRLEQGHSASRGCRLPVIGLQHSPIIEHLAAGQLCRSCRAEATILQQRGCAAGGDEVAATAVIEQFGHTPSRCGCGGDSDSRPAAGRRSNRQGEAIDRTLKLGAAIAGLPTPRAHR